MLVLTRGYNESIQIVAIDKVITITIVDVIRGKVRIGIVADKDVAIARSELLDRNHMEEK